MKKLAAAVEIAQWIIIVLLVFLAVWMLSSCVSMINLGRDSVQHYERPKHVEQSGTNNDSHDIDIELKP